MKLSRPNYGISRIDQLEKRNHGWFVRITVKGEVLSKFFADKSLGGKNAALQAARQHRDAMARKLPKERLESLARRRRNVKKSGTKGVTHVMTQDQAARKYEYWQASWTEKDGRRRTAKFSIAEHGDKKALEMARRHLAEVAPPAETRAPQANTARKAARAR